MLQRLLPALLVTLLAGCGDSGPPPAATTATGTAASAGAAPGPGQSCVALKGMDLLEGTATVEDATLLPAAGPLPEHCLAHARLRDSTLRFELRLPTVKWNRKLVFLGGGGFDGQFTQPVMPYVSRSVLAERYATVATNGGYDYPGMPDAGYFQAKFADVPLAAADFLFQSEHRALPPARAALRAFYGEAPTRSYFEGCSMGGHDALLQAQRYPQDFDGIVARAPAGNIIGLMLKFHQIAQRLKDPAAALDAPAQTLLAAGVLQQCDAQDGLEDGLIGIGSACQFDARTLRCAGGADAGDACLSDAQLQTVATITSPLDASSAPWTHPGYNFGGENSPKGWGEYIWPNPQLGGGTLQGFFSDGFLRAFVTRDPGFDTHGFSVREARAALLTVGGAFNAFDPDLKAFAARGGKLILWTGSNDSSVSPRDTETYYRNAVQSLGQELADRTLELFVAPGVGHCFGGPGADQIDLLQALDTWVEAGKAPSQQALVAQRLDGQQAVQLSRPLCRYPQVAWFSGQGKPEDAASFSCK